MTVLCDSRYSFVGLQTTGSVCHVSISAHQFPLPIGVYEVLFMYACSHVWFVLFCVLLSHYSLLAVSSFLMSGGCSIPLHLPLSCSCFLQVFDCHDVTSSHFYGDGQVGSLYLHCCLHILEVHMYIRPRFAFILYAHHSV